MPGAYVAKPEAVPDPPDVPPDWNPLWPFPGPLPPGYEPEYSLLISAPSSTPYDSAASVQVTLFDHESYETNEPETNSLAWSATVDGEMIPLRLEGIGEYVSSVSVEYSETDDFWGNVSSLEFQLTEEHDGKTLVLTATSAPFGEAVVDTAEIEIGGALEIEVSCSTVGTGTANFMIWSADLADLYLWLAWSGGVLTTEVNNLPDELTVEASGSGATIQASELDPAKNYWIVVSLFAYDDSAAISTTLECFGVTKEMSGSVPPPDIKSWTPWLTIDGATGEVTVVNP